MKKKIFYISYDGLLEPIGQSQILNYLIKISSNYKFFLLTFEKKSDLKNTRLLNYTKNKLLENNIEWKYCLYNNYSSFFGLNIIKGFFISNYIVFKNKITFLHIRSYVPGLMIFLFFFINK